MENIKTNLAVSAYVYHEGKFLLLKRSTSPFKWCPPGGRVHNLESLIDAVKRETKEESNLNVEVITPIDVWSGEHEGVSLHSIGFLCQVVSGEVEVSKEHTESKWLSVSELNDYSITHDIKIFQKAEAISRAVDKKQLVF
jgi:8-oxo-dGTP diphosphatase